MTKKDRKGKIHLLDPKLKIVSQRCNANRNEFLDCQEYYENMSEFRDHGNRPEGVGNRQDDRIGGHDNGSSGKIVNNLLAELMIENPNLLLENPPL